MSGLGLRSMIGLFCSFHIVREGEGMRLFPVLHVSKVGMQGMANRGIFLSCDYPFATWCLSFALLISQHWEKNYWMHDESELPLCITCFWINSTTFWNERERFTSQDRNDAVKRRLSTLFSAWGKSGEKEVPLCEKDSQPFFFPSYFFISDFDLKEWILTSLGKRHIIRVCWMR